MKKRILALLIAVSAVFLRDSAIRPLPPAPRNKPMPRPATCTDRAPLEAVTWNVGLAPGMVWFASARVGPVAETLRSLDYDVLCLQEAWRPDDQTRILESLALPHGNVFTIDTVGLGEPGDEKCEPGEIADVLACVRNRCADVPAEDVTICAMDRCQTDLAFLFMKNRKCLDCLASCVGRSASEIFDVCTSRSSSRIYGGRNGAILASRWPLVMKEVVFLPSSGANRVALFARVGPPGAVEPIEIACAHVSSPQKIPPMHSGYPDWPAEQRAQFAMIAERLAVRAGGRPQLLLGDMNFGPAESATIWDASRSVYDDALRLGFSSPAASARPPLCSACGDNTLRGAPGVGFLFDHVFLRDPGGGMTLAPLCADRLFDLPVTVPDGSETVSTHLSDHYAIRVKFSYGP